MKPKTQPVSYVRPVGPMDSAKIPAQRMKVGRGIGDMGNMWCPRPKFQRATKDKLRILTGHLKAIMKDTHRPLDGTVQIARGVRRRVTK